VDSKQGSHTTVPIQSTQPLPLKALASTFIASGLPTSRLALNRILPISLELLSRLVLPWRPLAPTQACGLQPLTRSGAARKNALTR